jgi:hypothetical protein
MDPTVRWTAKAVHRNFSPLMKFRCCFVSTGDRMALSIKVSQTRDGLQSNRDVLSGGAR